jgi:hypothetical protein
LHGSGFIFFASNRATKAIQPELIENKAPMAGWLAALLSGCGAGRPESDSGFVDRRAE